MSATTAVTYDMTAIDDRAPNVGRQFFDRVRATPDREAYRYPEGDAWESQTWRETGDQSPGSPPAWSRWASSPSSGSASPPAPASSGSSPTSRSCAPGGATTTVYPSTMADDVAYILGRLRVPGGVRRGRHPDRQAARSASPSCRTWPRSSPSTATHRRRLGDRPGRPGEARRASCWPSNPRRRRRPRSPRPRPDSLATLIYTSGTTGRPKGVRLQHTSWTYEGAAIQAQGILDEDDLQFLWLPMAHSFGKVLLSTQLAFGFATAVDGRVDKIIDNLPSSARRSWAPRRGSSRRRTAGSSPCRPPRAG